VTLSSRSQRGCLVGAPGGPGCLVGNQDSRLRCSQDSPWTSQRLVDDCTMVLAGTSPQIVWFSFLFAIGLTHLSSVNTAKGICGCWSVPDVGKVCGFWGGGEQVGHDL
jgi:hypothetical protein